MIRPGALAPRLGGDRWFRRAAATVVAVGIALRILTMVGYSPGDISHPDTAWYVGSAAHSLFSDPFRPVGYALFLRLLHSVSPNVSFTIAVQHLVGLATALLAYRLCRQIGSRRAVALLPAAAVLVSGDQLYLEYSLLSDCLFLALLVLSGLLAVSIPSSEDPSGWRGPVTTLAAALVTALTAEVRTVGVALVPVLIVWVLRYGGARRAVRVRRAAAAAVVCLAVLLGYAAAQQQATGVFGLSRFGGWPLYARVAPIADCHRFHPPAGTAVLCEKMPISQRPGPDFYLWNPYSRAEWFLGYPPSHASLVGSFALSTIVHEPLSYLGLVTRDLGRYIDPSLVTGQLWGADWRSLALNQPPGSADPGSLRAVTGYYRNVHLHVRDRLMDTLESWRGIFRVHGVLIVLLTLLGCAGLRLSSDRRTTRGIVLLAAFAIVLIVVPTATMSYEARYGLPASLLLVIIGARGGELMLVCLRALRWSAVPARSISARLQGGRG